MDIIEIDSSDSDDDMYWPESPDTSTCVSPTNLWRNNSESSLDHNHSLQMNLQTYPGSNNNEKVSLVGSSMNRSVPRAGAGTIPQLHGHGEHSQKRTLPSSFRPLTSNPYSEHSTGYHRGPSLSQVKEPRLVKPSNVSEADFSNMANHRSTNDNKLPQRTQKRVLPPSIQQTTHRVAAEGKKNMAYEYETSDKRRLPSSSSANDDVLIYKSTGTHRVLPPSLMNGKSVDSPVLVGATDVGKSSGLGEQRLMEHDERAIYQEVLQNLSQPNLEDDLPEGLLSVSLLKHQKIALAWMVQKESSAHCTGGILADDQGLGKTISMIALIQKERPKQAKFTSSDSQQTTPKTLLSLDDDDGDAGVTELHKENQLEKDDTKSKQETHTSMQASSNRRLPAGTLVVCPASVLRQWARELDEKVTSSAKLSVLVYHGGTRTRDPSELAKYDVVLTTYSIVTNEVPKSGAAADDGEQKNPDKYEISSEFSSNKRKQTDNARSKGKKKKKSLNDSHFDSDSGALAKVRWYRVILDEAQTIKNHRTQVAKACSGLRAKKRWCLSGTPIQNSIDDLYSYFRFLKYEPYSKYNVFCSGIKFAISRNAVSGYMKLQALFKVLLLRRTKGTLINGEPIIKLPPKSVVLKKVDFSPEERSFYLKLESDSRQQFKKFAAAGTVRQNYASILLMLLRLRQACDHPVLVKGYHSDTVGKESLDVARQLPKDMLLNLLHQLEGSLAICRVCNDPPEDALVTMCGHVFCYQCVSERLTGDENLCPAAGCKGTLSPDSVFSRTTLLSCISHQFDDNASSSGLTNNEESSIVQRGYVSSKIKATLEILNSLCSPSYKIGMEECGYVDANPDIPAKAIVFSQWTGMLDLLEASLNASLIQYRRLDGSMTLASRDRSVKEFNTDPEVTVMIMSLKAGNLGLNMVAACHVILLDLWWNPTTEDQAIDRAHRIGQTRPVTVSRMTIKDTVEDRILALQDEKRKMVSSAFGEDQPGGHSSKLTVDDLKYLFQAY